MLCELLKQTGVAGRPEEYFEARACTGLPAQSGDYLQDLPRTGAGIRDDASPPEGPAHSSLLGLRSYREHLERTFRLGTGANGVFGAKIMSRHLPDLLELAGGLPEYGELELGELLPRLFGEPRYVWVTRRDKVRQAVSLWRALQTRAWRAEHGKDSGRAVELHYRFEGIDHLVRLLRAEDDAWGEFFATHRIAALPVAYEGQLEVDREGTVRSVLEHIGVPAPADLQLEEVTRRQADALSDEWVAAYHRDAAVSASRAVALPATP